MEELDEKYKNLIHDENTKESSEGDSDTDPLVMDLAEALKPKFDQPTPKKNDSDTDTCDSSAEFPGKDILGYSVDNSETESCDSRTDDSVKKKRDDPPPKQSEGTSMKQLKNFVNFYKVSKDFEQKYKSKRHKKKNRWNFSMSSLSDVKDAINNVHKNKSCKLNDLRKWKSEIDLKTCDEFALEFSLKSVREFLLGENTIEKIHNLEFISEPVLSPTRNENSFYCDELYKEAECDPLSAEDQDVKPSIDDLLDSSYKKEIQESSPKKGLIKLRNLSELVENEKVLENSRKRLNIPVKFHLKDFKVIGPHLPQKSVKLAPTTVSSVSKQYLCYSDSAETTNTHEIDGFCPKIEAAFSLAGSEAISKNTPKTLVGLEKGQTITVPISNTISSEGSNVFPRRISTATMYAKISPEGKMIRIASPIQLKQIQENSAVPLGKNRPVSLLGQSKRAKVLLPKKSVDSKIKPVPESESIPPIMFNVLSNMEITTPSPTKYTSNAGSQALPNTFKVSPTKNTGEKTNVLSPSKTINNLHEKGSILIKTNGQVSICTLASSIQSNSLVQSTPTSSKPTTISSLEQITKASSVISPERSLFDLLKRNPIIISQSNKLKTPTSPNETIIGNIKLVKPNTNGTDQKTNLTVAGKSYVYSVGPNEESKSQPSQGVLNKKLEFISTLQVCPNLSEVSTKLPYTIIARSGKTDNISVRSQLSENEKSGIQSFQIPELVLSQISHQVNPSLKNLNLLKKEIPENVKINKFSIVKQNLTRQEVLAEKEKTDKAPIAEQNLTRKEVSAEKEKTHEAPIIEQNLTKEVSTEKEITNKGLTVDRHLIRKEISSAKEKTNKAPTARQNLTRKEVASVKGKTDKAVTVIPGSLKLVPPNKSHSIPSSSTIAKTQLLFKVDVYKKDTVVGSMFKGDVPRKYLNKSSKYFCAWCKIGFIKRYLLAQHMHRITCNMVYDCVSCGRKILFRNRCQLLSHLLTHFGNHLKIVINYSKLKIFKLSMLDIMYSQTNGKNLEFYSDEESGDESVKKIKDVFVKHNAQTPSSASSSLPQVSKSNTIKSTNAQSPLISKEPEEEITLLDVTKRSLPHSISIIPKSKITVNHNVISKTPQLPNISIVPKHQFKINQNMTPKLSNVSTESNKQITLRVPQTVVSVTKLTQTQDSYNQNRQPELNTSAQNRILELTTNTPAQAVPETLLKTTRPVDAENTNAKLTNNMQQLKSGSDVDEEPKVNILKRKKNNGKPSAISLKVPAKKISTKPTQDHYTNVTEIETNRLCSSEPDQLTEREVIDVLSNNRLNTVKIKSFRADIIDHYKNNVAKDDTDDRNENKLQDGKKDENYENEAQSNVSPVLSSNERPKETCYLTKMKITRVQNDVEIKTSEFEQNKVLCQDIFEKNKCNKLEEDSLENNTEKILKRKSQDEYNDFVGKKYKFESTQLLKHGDKELESNTLEDDTSETNEADRKRKNQEECARYDDITTNILKLNNSNHENFTSACNTISVDLKLNNPSNELGLTQESIFESSSLSNRPRTDTLETDKPNILSDKTMKTSEMGDSKVSSTKDNVEYNTETPDLIESVSKDTSIDMTCNIENSSDGEENARLISEDVILDESDDSQSEDEPSKTEVFQSVNVKPTSPMKVQPQSDASPALCHVCQLNPKNLCFHPHNKPSEKYICNYAGPDPCRAIMTNQCTLICHTNLHERKKPYICPDCGRTFYLYQTLSDHMKSNCKHRNRTTGIRCTFCEYVVERVDEASTTQALQKHFIEKHFEKLDSTREKFNCNLCPKLIPVTLHLNDVSLHIKFHCANEKNYVYRYKCDNCSELFVRKYLLNAHVCTRSTKS